MQINGIFTMKSRSREEEEGEGEPSSNCVSLCAPSTARPCMRGKKY